MKNEHLLRYIQYNIRFSACVKRTLLHEKSAFRHGKRVLRCPKSFFCYGKRSSVISGAFSTLISDVFIMQNVFVSPGKRYARCAKIFFTV